MLKNKIGTKTEHLRNNNNNVNNENNEINTIAVENASNVNWYDRFHQCFNRIPNEFQRQNIIGFLEEGVEEALIIHAFEKAA
jgi:hypothetical protein